MTKAFIAPPHAGQHCRHYDYEPGLKGGPRCAQGVDLSAPTATMQCMPDSRAAVCCDWREEHTEEERAAWARWREERTERMIMIMPLIPGNSTDRKNRPEWGKFGEFDCPACGEGKVRWSRARVNGHVRAGCSTPGCFGMIQ